MTALVGVMRLTPATCVRQIANRTSTEERAMSQPPEGSTRGSVKTLAIRLEPELHAQLTLIAQLRDSTITDEIRTAIEAHIATAKAAPDLAARADGMLDDIERDASARRQALSALFGNAEAGTTGSRGRRTGRKEEASES